MRNKLLPAVIAGQEVLIAAPTCSRSPALSAPTARTPPVLLPLPISSARMTLLLVTSRRDRVSAISWHLVLLVLRLWLILLLLRLILPLLLGLVLLPLLLVRIIVAVPMLRQWLGIVTTSIRMSRVRLVLHLPVTMHLLVLVVVLTSL